MLFLESVEKIKSRNLQLNHHHNGPSFERFRPVLTDAPIFKHVEKIDTRTRFKARQRKHPRTMRGALDSVRTRHKDVDQIHKNTARHAIDGGHRREIPGTSSGHVKQIDTRTRSTVRRRKHPRTMRGTQPFAAVPVFTGPLDPLRA
jgi:hypothetical protein